MSALERLVLATVEHLQERLPEGASIVTATSLPRGADPLAGGERPMLCAGIRLAALPPAGVVIGGGPAALAQFLGFSVPDRPEAPAAEAEAAADEDGEAGAEASAEPAAEPESPAPADEAGDDAPGDEDAAPADAAEAASDAGPSWSSQLVGAARPAVAPFLTELAHSIGGLAALPVECTPVRLELTEQPRSVVGPVPDGLVVVIDVGGQEVRLVVIASGVLLARMDAAVGPASTEGDEAPAADAGERETAGIERTLTEVPLDISLRVGRVHTPLAAVTRLRDGDLLELEAAPDDPVELVAGTTPVASGTLEVAPDGALQLFVTRVDDAAAGGLPPRTPHAAVSHGDGAPGGPALVAIDGAGGDEPAAESPTAGAPEATGGADPGAPGDGDGAA